MTKRNECIEDKPCINHQKVVRSYKNKVKTGKKEKAP